MPEKRTATLKHPHGPLVVDVWEARQPSAAPPILLIHGWGGTGSYWQDTARHLSATVRVIVPDLPGTGRSRPVRKPQNMFDQVRSLRFVLDELHVDCVQVVGHSMGGAMAVLLADAQPERVERLALTSLCFFMSGAQEQMYKVAMGMFKVSLNFRPSWLASLPLVPQLVATRYFHRVPDDAELLRQGLLDYLELDTGTAVACANDAPNPVITAAGSRLRQPTLLVACRQDRVMPIDNVAFTVRTIPNAYVRWIDQCGHLPMVEKPAEYWAILHDFLQL
ncbi:MAG: alpha/beta hydrolase [Anaerolineales bacterium]|nr:alpha/beta hydrolase [Anaerolineales bacterium]